MSTIKEKLFFNYDGIWSKDFGLLHCTLDSGMFEEALTASRSPVETRVKGKDKSHFSGFEYSPLAFDMTIAFEHGFTDDKLQKVIHWLIKDYYKPLFFEGKEDKLYYCMVTDQPQIVHTGTGEGYITLTMHCNSPFIYSPVIVSAMVDLSTSGVGTIEIFNEGTGYLFPEISIEKVGNGNVLIRNVNNGGEEFRINGLTNGEDLYINTEKEIIRTDLENLGVYRYNNTVGEFTRLSEGKNLIQIEGTCRIQFRYQMKYRF